ncbi:hypothetical protein HO173_002775 [Letharia columbiana]|uniref:Uncharacterized protein n=1 Tax=Letharia columbiana TaxID=112416 RepID=A0A8H6G228_9LECA|nr:uncharacterized protein HO173_002775 [Letharia columbiana]KAF6238903.1 hypothetical protein HO173_002775 [Letharia columbiana]
MPSSPMASLTPRTPLTLSPSHSQIYTLAPDLCPTLHESEMKIAKKDIQPENSNTYHSYSTSPAYASSENLNERLNIHLPNPLPQNPSPRARLNLGQSKRKTRRETEPRALAPRITTPFREAYFSLPAKTPSSSDADPEESTSPPPARYAIQPPHRRSNNRNSAVRHIPIPAP